MTRKDYIAIAAAIKTSAMQLPTDSQQFQKLQHSCTANCVADVLEQDNPRFDRAKFLTARVAELEAAMHRICERFPEHHEAATIARNAINSRALIAPDF